MGLKDAVRRGINQLGFDVIRLHRSPKRTFLGLAELNIRTVIDVGANEGQFARMVSCFFPRAKPYCFEPLGEPFRELLLSAQSQGSRVECFRMALGDSDGEVEMRLHTQHTPSSSLLRATETCHRLYPQTKAESIPYRPSIVFLKASWSTCRGTSC